VQFEHSRAGFDGARFAVVGSLVVWGRSIERVLESALRVAAAWPAVELRSTPAAASAATAATDWTTPTSGTAFPFLSHVSPSKKTCAQTNARAAEA
jgi:hypothetical protein